MSPSQSSMRLIQLISVVDLVRQVHLGHQLSCEMSWKVKRMCGPQSCWGESAANSAQLVSRAAEAVIPGLCILVLIMVMRHTQNLLFGCWGLVELRVVPVTQKAAAQ